MENIKLLQIEKEYSKAVNYLHRQKQIRFIKQKQKSFFYFFLKLFNKKSVFSSIKYIN